MNTEMNEGMAPHKKVSIFIIWRSISRLKKNSYQAVLFYSINYSGTSSVNQTCNHFFQSAVCILYTATLRTLRNTESFIPSPILNFLLLPLLASLAVGYVQHPSGSVAAVPWRCPFCGQLLQWRSHTIQLPLYCGTIEGRLHWADGGVPCHGQPALDRQSLRSLEEWPSRTLQRELVWPQEQFAGTHHKSRHHGGKLYYRIHCTRVGILILATPR